MSTILDLLADIPTNAVLRERIAFIREQAQALEKKIAELEQENSALKKRVTELESEVTAKTETKQFVEHRGALFKRKPSGGYDLAVYCPRCRESMTSTMNVAPFYCFVCRAAVNLTGSQLSAIMRELPA